MSPLLVVVAIRFLPGAPEHRGRSDGTKLSVGLARVSPGARVARRRSAAAGWPPSDGDEPSKEDSCGLGSRGSCGARRSVSRTSRRPLSERIDPDSAGPPLDAASQMARAVPPDTAREVAPLLPHERLPASCSTIWTWLPSPAWTCTALCEIALEPLFVEVADEWLCPEPAVDSAFT